MFLGTTVIREASVGKQVRLEMLKRPPEPQPPPQPQGEAKPGRAGPGAAGTSNGNKKRRRKGAEPSKAAEPTELNAADVSPGNLPRARRDKADGVSRIPGPTDPRFPEAPPPISMFNKGIVDAVNKEMYATPEAARYSRHHPDGRKKKAGDSLKRDATFVQPGPTTGSTPPKDAVKEKEKPKSLRMARIKEAPANGPRFPSELQCTEFVQHGVCPRGTAW